MQMISFYLKYPQNMFCFKIINNFCVKANNTLKLHGYKTRPGADFGLMLPILLPIAFIRSAYLHNIEASHFFKLNSIASFGLFCVTIVQWLQINKQTKLKLTLGVLFCGLFTSFLIWICLNRGVLFSSISGLFICSLYAYLVPFILRALPFSFTFGESAIVTQGAVLFIFTSVLNIHKTLNEDKIPDTDGDIITVILQIGIMGVGFIALLAYAYKSLRAVFGFYLLSALVAGFGILPALHIILKRSPILWLLEFMFENTSRILILGFWALSSFVAIICIRSQIAGGKKATTAVRKVFHILAVSVFVPGLILQCTLLYIASGVVLALFIVIETLRVLSLPPFGDILQDGFTIYADEKDSGSVALTPMYLLAGCAIPIWLHPCACDFTDSAGLHLTMLAGIMSVGVGDTAASIFGSNYGKHKWPGSPKSFEGTFGSMLCQLTLILFLMKFGYLFYSITSLSKSVLAIIINALVEAKTDQVDNLTLPIISYILLS